MILKLRDKGLLIAAVPAAVSLICLFGLFKALEGAEHDLQRQLTGSRLSALAANIQLNYYGVILAARQWHSSRSPEAGASFDRLIALIQRQEAELEKMPMPDERFDKLIRVTLDDAKAARVFLFRLRNGASTHFGGELDPRIFHKNGLAFMDSLTEDFRRLDESAGALVLASDSARSRSFAVAVLAVGALANIAVAIALAIYFSGTVAARINILQDNAVRLAASQSLAPPIGGGDEIASLDRAFHRMAQALAEAGRKETALLDNATDVLCSIDSELRFVRVSAAVTSLWGYKPEEVAGMRVRELLASPATIEKLGKFIGGAVESGTFDGKLNRRDGRTIDVQFSTYWSEAEGALFCVVRDVTRERELERIKQQLMDTIAHDLRSPIASLKIVFDSLKEGLAGELNERGVVIVGRAEKSTERLLRLVNDLLDYEKFASGHFTLQPVRGSLSDLLHACTYALEGLIEEKQLQVDVLGEDFAVCVDGDRMTQAVVNLLANAVKFSPVGGKIVLKTRSEKDLALVEICDSGPGVPMSMREQIFERFRQVDQSVDRANKGTGLGLPIARQIIEAHGGQVGVRDNSGAGAVFWFTLPVLEEGA